MRNINGILCNNCFNNKKCSRGFNTGLFCQYIKDDNTLLAATILDRFLTSISNLDLGIYFEMLKIFSTNAFDFEKNLKNKNIRNMVRVLAEIDLFRKISLSTDDTNYHYANAKAYYKRLFGETQEDDHVIKLIEGDHIDFL